MALSCHPCRNGHMCLQATIVLSLMSTMADQTIGRLLVSCRDRCRNRTSMWKYRSHPPGDGHYHASPCSTGVAVTKVVIADHRTRKKDICWARSPPPSRGLCPLPYRCPHHHPHPRLRTSSSVLRIVPLHPQEQKANT
jgi:hypothetical protein